MPENVGNLDRLFRLILGAVLFLMPVITQAPMFDAPVLKYATMIIGLILAGTSAFKFCPLYRLFGISTCRR